MFLYRSTSVVTVFLDIVVVVEAHIAEISKGSEEKGRQTIHSRAIAIATLEVLEKNTRVKGNISN